MRKLILAIACLALLSAPAFADAFYAPAWSFHTNGGNGSVSTFAGGFTLTGSDGVCCGGFNTTYSIRAAQNGYVDFTNINFHTNDIADFSFDPSSIKLNGSPLVTVNTGSADQNFFGTVFMSAGDVLSFEVFTTDGCCGAAQITASGVTSTVPEPGTMALLGTGILGLGFRRFRKN